jgi:thiol:disulfide interchange protein DsbC
MHRGFGSTNSECPAVILRIHASDPDEFPFLENRLVMHSINAKAMLSAMICLFALPVAAQRMAPVDSLMSAEPDAVRAQENASPGKPVGMAMDAKIRAIIKQLSPDLDPDYIGPAIVPGYQEVIIKGQVVFVTDDGNYLVQGLMDIRRKRDIAQLGALPGLRLLALKDIPASERIVFAPDGPRKHTVTVFTDIECVFCRKFHQDIGEYNRLGIAIEYLAYPRAGMGTPDAIKTESVWCSTDRRKALTDAKNEVAIPTLACDSPVAKHWQIGQRIGLQGTPMILNADGIALPGYMPPRQLLEALDALADRAKTE